MDLTWAILEDGYSALKTATVLFVWQFHGKNGASYDVLLGLIFTPRTILALLWLKE
jgi:hypothetical protein